MSAIPSKCGYAAVDMRGEILVDTVSASRRAAMVNWLVSHGRLSVHQNDTDQKIADTFMVAATQRGLATIEEVTISVSERSHPEPDSDFRERIRLHPMARGCDLDTHNHILTATGALLDEVGGRFGMQRLP